MMRRLRFALCIVHASGGSPATCVASHASAVPQKYQSHEIVQLLEELGLDFGACSNAYTSADETVRLQSERARY